MNEHIQANYDTLAQIAQRFQQTAENNTQLHTRLTQQVDQLRQAGWEGRGAAAFFSQMDGQVFPAVQRLSVALEQAQSVTLHINAVLQEAESLAANLFNVHSTNLSSLHASPIPTSLPGSLPERPDPPPQPPNDGSGEHGAKDRNLLQQQFDLAQKQLWYGVAAAADAAGMDDAARHMRHFLGNSGEDLNVNPENILNDLPDFKDKSQIVFERQVLDEANQIIGENYDGTPMRFSITTPWQLYPMYQPTLSDQLSNQGNWYYALGSFSYCYGADIVVTPDAYGRPQVQIEYQMHIFDRYNWDEDKGVAIGIIPVPDTALGHLHQVGIAQEYEVWGTSEPSTITYTYPDQNMIESPGLPAGGDETRDKLRGDQVISRDDPRLDLPDRDARTSPGQIRR